MMRPTRLSHGPWKSYPTFGRGKLVTLIFTALAVLGNEGNKVAAARRAASI